MIQFAQPLVSDRVYQIPGIDALKSSPSITSSPVNIGGFLTWPNEVTKAPDSIFKAEVILVAGGWFVPTKTRGGIWYSTRSKSGKMSKWVPIIEKEGWFYHRVLYVITGPLESDGTNP
jgi:hypothetical protein